MIGIRTQLKRYLVAIYLNFNHINYASIPEFVGPWPKFSNKGQLFIGEKCRFRTYRLRQIMTVQPNAILAFGTKCYLGDGINICAAKKIVIGANTQLAPNVSIYDTNFHPVQQGEKAMEVEVVLGKNVWIGENSIILPGTSVGDHSIIGANSVVTRNIPGRVVAAGNPARVIKNISCDDDWVRR